jgi:hypothetical protein
MTVLNVSDILTHAAENGGGTYARSFEDDFWLTVERDSGYMVSMQGFEMQVPQSEFTVWRLTEFIKNRAEEFDYAFLGIWEEGDIVYLDCSLWVRDKDVAKRLAIKNAQLAFWDCENAVAIPA